MCSWMGLQFLSRRLVVAGVGVGTSRHAAVNTREPGARVPGSMWGRGGRLLRLSYSQIAVKQL